MKFMKKLMLGAAVAMSLATAQASTINVGGVIWDPNSNLDFNSFSLAEHQFISPVVLDANGMPVAGGTVSGFGLVSTFNGTGAAQFCPGCQLTFQFGGFTPVIAGSTPAPNGTTIGYSGGWVKVYVYHGVTSINPFDATSLTAANTGLGDLFLDLVGHNVDGSSLTGTIVSNGIQVTGLSGIGQLDAIGGLAFANFNTNTQLGGSDLSFTNSFSQLTDPTDALGTGNFHGDTVAGNTVPEPASLALAGLALLGAGVARRRKS